MYENRINHLEESHKQLDKQIDGLEKTGTFDDLKMQNLKKQRLQFRDELARLRKLQWEHDHETIHDDD
jgi:uncharacterized protein YdcH (DUF465 family)